MTTFNIHCDDPWFSYIRQGIKPVEGRKATHSYKKIKAGDFINFTNGKESFVAAVTEIREYPSIEQYLDDVSRDGRDSSDLRDPSDSVNDLSLNIASGALLHSEENIF
jgi:ASC-1-like (ASCH) protein